MLFNSASKNYVKKNYDGRRTYDTKFKQNS